MGGVNSTSRKWCASHQGPFHCERPAGHPGFHACEDSKPGPDGAGEIHSWL